MSVTVRALYSQRDVIQDVHEMGLQTGPENSHGRCGGRVFRQHQERKQ